MATALIGYASEAVVGLRLNEQIARLKEAGCDRIHTDSGEKPGQGISGSLTDALSTAASGDTLVICDLPRLSRRID